MFRIGAELHHIKYVLQNSPLSWNSLVQPQMPMCGEKWYLMIVGNGVQFLLHRRLVGCTPHPQYCKNKEKKQTKPTNQTTTATTNHGSGNSLAGNNRFQEEQKDQLCET